MADRTVSVTLLAKTSGFVSGINAATKATKDFTAAGLDKIGKNEQHISSLSNKAGALGLAFTGMAVLAVKAFSDFDKAISSVAATGDDAKDNLNELREAAIIAGRDTAFSASEAAAGVEELLKAGVQAEDVLGGGLDGALNLAASGALGVAEAAEIAATAMTQFSLKGDQVNHVADLLASGASKAQGGVSDLGQALKQSGLVADQTGLSIEETVAGLTSFAAAGLIGSDAGTSFKAMLQRLTPQSKEASKLMDELGISAYDAGGNFVGLEAFAGNLRESLIDLTPEQRNSALATIFGSDAVRAASVIYENGAEGIAKWTEAVDDQGFAAETAATRLDNLAGDMEALRGSIETALIGLGEAGNGPLRGLVQQLTGVVNAFSEAPDTVKALTLSLVGGGGLVLLGIAGLGKLAIAVNDVRTAMVALKIGAKTAGLAVAGIGGVLAIATLAVANWASAQAEATARTQEFQATLDEFGDTTEQTLSHINDLLSEAKSGGGIAALFGGPEARSAIDIADEMGVAIVDLQGYILGNEGAIKRVNEATKQYAKDGLAVSTSAYRDNQFAGQELIKVLDEQGDGLTSAQKAAGQKALADEAAGEAQDELGVAYDDTTAAVEEQVDVLQDLIDAQAEAAGIVLDAREAMRAFEGTVDEATEALKDNGATLDLNTAAGRANEAALDGIAEAGLEVVDSMKQNGATQEQLTGQVARTRDEFVKAATAFGLSADEANRLADEMGLIPDRITPTVDLDTTSAWQKLADLQRALSVAAGKNIPIPYSSETHPGFAEGGYTGDGGKWEPKGVVHGGEFVMDKEHTAQYRPILEAMHQDRYVPGFAGGGLVGAAPTQSAGYSGPLVNVERVVQGTPQDIGAEVKWALAGRQL